MVEWNIHWPLHSSGSLTISECPNGSELASGRDYYSPKQHPGTMARISYMSQNGRFAMLFWLMIALLSVVDVVPWTNLARLIASASVHNSNHVNEAHGPHRLLVEATPLSATPSASTSPSHQVGQTEAPTAKVPSPPPTPALSKLPTSQPTSATPLPTQQPSKAPSHKPTKKPNPSPTHDPSNQVSIRAVAG